MSLMTRLVGFLVPRRRLAEQLRQRGRPAVAELTAADRTNTYYGAAPGTAPKARLWKLHLRVRPEDQPEFDAMVKERFAMSTGPVVGSSFPVVFDPERPANVMIDGRAGDRIPTTYVEDPTIRAGRTIDLRGQAQPPPESDGR